MELPIKTKTYIERLIFTLTKHPHCNLGQCYHYIETSTLIYGANQRDSFYIMATLYWNKLILTTTFSRYYHFLSWRNPLPQMSNLTRHTFHKNIKPRMQAENLANNSHKQFYVLLNSNQSKLCTYPDLLKENPLLRSFLNSKWTAYVLDETFYHTHILLFSTTISAAIVIKATKYSMYFIIHNSYDVATKYSIISTEKCKVVLPGW